MSATVDAAALLGCATRGGLVNAVLRRFQREREQLERRRSKRARGAIRASALGSSSALRADRPRRVAADPRRQQRSSADVAARELAAHDARADYLAKLAAAGLAACRRAGRRVGGARSRSRVGVESLPGFAAGEVSVQDVSAQRAARCSSSSPVSACSTPARRPGGKTGHILEARRRRAARSGPSTAMPRALAERAREPRAARTRRRSSSRATRRRPEDWWDGRPFDRMLSTRRAARPA